VREEGPDHDKHYAVEVLIDGTVWGSGQGSSKKQAQKSAARTAVKRLREKGIVDSSS
jgi:ribonuclease-3